MYTLLSAPSWVLQNFQSLAFLRHKDSKQTQNSPAQVHHPCLPVGASGLKGFSLNPKPKPQPRAFHATACAVQEDKTHVAGNTHPTRSSPSNPVSITQLHRPTQHVTTPEIPISMPNSATPTQAEKLKTPTTNFTQMRSGAAAPAPSLTYTSAHCR